MTKDDFRELIEGQHRIENRLISLESQSRMSQWLVGGVGFSLIAAVFIKFFE